MIEKTDMLTPEQFNTKNKGKQKVNCLGFAIGISEAIELDASHGRLIEDSFQSKLAKYGLIVKKVESLEEIKGKTGFLLYGFYPVRTLFGIEKIDFHVVRVNPDGSLVHKQDKKEPAKEVELLDDRGGIEEYNEENEPIQIFSLEEERNMDIEGIKNRANEVFSQISQVYNNSDISDNEKEVLKQESLKIKESLSGENKTLNSNEINIILQKIHTLTKEKHLEIDFEGMEH